MAKWFERGIKKQKPQFFGRDSLSMSLYTYQTLLSKWKV